MVALSRRLDPTAERSIHPPRARQDGDPPFAGRRVALDSRFPDHSGMEQMSVSAANPTYPAAQILQPLLSP